jgi:AraC family transcriptional regulator of adaptative response/methylated-DNA-[protein]-cysteine methyltransferase
MATTHETASLPFAHDGARWAAVVRRHRNADGLFYHTVQTTRVYCRPSCPARLARREHVQFHATREAAERTGFRPCKRCRPHAAARAEHHAVAVEKACRLIEHADAVPNLDALAAAVGTGHYYFHRVFTAITGVTPKAYAVAHRAQRVQAELSRTATVTEAIYGGGSIPMGVATQRPRRC